MGYIQSQNLVLQRRNADTMEFIYKNIMVEHCQNLPMVWWQMYCNLSHESKQITDFTTWQSHKQCLCIITVPRGHFISGNAVKSNVSHPQIPPFKWNTYLNGWPSWHSQGAEQISTNCSLKKIQLSIFYMVHTNGELYLLMLAIHLFVCVGFLQMVWLCLRIRGPVLPSKTKNLLSTSNCLDNYLLNTYFKI